MDDVPTMPKRAGRLGDLQRVPNQQPKLGAAARYNFLRVQLEDGREVQLLLTDKEVQRAMERAEKNPEDCPPVSRLRDWFD